MNKGSELRNRTKLTIGMIIPPHRINRRTLGRLGFNSPVKEPRITVGTTTMTKVIASVLLRLRSEKTDQSIDDGCERRNRTIQMTIFALITKSIRCRTSWFCENETNEYVITAPAVTARIMERITRLKLKSVCERISHAYPEKPATKKAIVKMTKKQMITMLSCFVSSILLTVDIRPFPLIGH